MKLIKENKPDLLQKALDSLEGMERATPGPFFYTRLEARMLNRKRSFWEMSGNLLSRPAVVIGGLCLILLMNTLAIFDQSSKLASANETGELTLVEEYTIASNNSLLDYENVDLK